jgi:hypothetical protein
VTDPAADGTTEDTEQWSVHLKGNLGVLGTEHTFPALEGEHFARARVETWRRTRPDVQTTLLRRQVITWYGAWTPVLD